MKRITLILIFQLAFISLFSQDKLTRFTYSVVDTTKSQKSQAEDIYNWITHNISYDTKQLKKGLKSYTPVQTIHRKKAVCYGYSQLFNSMCNILGIESYIILGNAKGLGYVKGDNILKSDHSWNIVYTDSTWILIDATWGSGYLSYDYDLKNKIKRIFNKNSGLKSKLVFTKQPTLKYFNIAPGELCKTHFPIDSKWQLREYPISYYSFIADSNSNSQFLNYKKEIAKVRFQDMSSQIFIDALNSTKYNPYNKFDIASEYYLQASFFSIGKKTVLDSTLLKTLLRSNRYYDSALVYLTQFKVIRRNFYQEKKQNQRSAQRMANTSLNKINKIPTVYNNRYSGTYNKLLRNEMTLDKLRQKIYNSKINISLRSDFDFDTISIPDTIRIYEYTQKTEKDLSKVSKYFTQLHQLADSIETKQFSGQYDNDTILYWLINISDQIWNIKASIDQMDEYDVIQTSNKISHNYNHYISKFDLKKQLETEIITDYNNFINRYERTELTLFSVVNSYTRLAKLTGDNKTYNQKVSDVYDSLQELYDLVLSAISKVKQHNDSWKELVYKQNDILSDFGLNGITAVINKTTEFFKYLKAKNDKSYLNDMKTYNSMRSDSKKNLTIIKAVIREIN